MGAEKKANKMSATKLDELNDKVSGLQLSVAICI